MVTLPPFRGLLRKEMPRQPANMCLRDDSLERRSSSCFGSTRCGKHSSTSTDIGKRERA